MRTAVQNSRVEIPADNVTLEGELQIPENCSGIVLFAHGSGSSRNSPRNRYVAKALNDGNLGTLLFDLLTPEEGRQEYFTRHLRFDIPFLARRLLHATTWLEQERPDGFASLGYLGASSGAAAALVAAAEHSGEIKAIVSRGGRPDLAEDSLAGVLAPTLLIVGGDDFGVVELNRDAFAQLGGHREIVTVPGATHLFEEAGALEQVALLARDWFTRYL